MVTNALARSPVPSPPTTFIGRQREVIALCAMLATPACRLVTITGPGGIGKTRLALAVANQCREAFADGVAVASLQATSRSDQLATVIAMAIGCPLSGEDEASVQLLAYARPKAMLLVLDNFEHLVDGATLLVALLAAAPDLHLLVTSREALNLQEEWRFPLSGLTTPADEQAQQLADAEAVQLFVERARRVRPAFRLEDNPVAIARICQLVEGAPLALELAAAWVQALPPAAIADELALSLALLHSPLRDLPDRHRSMRATCDYSWARLTDAERAAFIRLAVFRGGFRREAAEAVAGATLSLLAALIDKSLLRCEADGRYRLHELLRQYAEERLRGLLDAWDETRDRHCTYYLIHLAGQFDAFIGGDRPCGLRDVAAEMENFRFAWEFALAHGRFAAIRNAMFQFQTFYFLRGPYTEAIALMERTVGVLRDALPEPQAALALAFTLNVVGWQYVRVGRFAEATAAWTESRDRYTGLAVPLPMDRTSDPSLGLAMIALIDGRYADAARLGEEARHRAADTGHQKDLPYAWYMLTQAALAQGQDDVAGNAAIQAAAAAEAAGDRWFLAYCRIDLGVVAERAGDYAEARQQYRASYRLREEFADPQGMAIALAHLGRVALRQSDLAEARAEYERSRVLYADLGDRGGLAAVLHGLGLVALAEGDIPGASGYLTQALELAAALRFAPLLLTILAGAGELLIHIEQLTLGTEVLALVRSHPATEREVAERAQCLLTDLEPRLAPAAYLAAITRGRAEAPEQVLVRIRATLSGREGPGGPSRSATDMNGQSVSRLRPAMSAVDALTAREMAILRLIAEGCSNQEIAGTLFLAVSTVKWYAGNLFGKLQVRSRTEAVARARSLGLLP